MRQAQANGITLEYDTFGNPEDAPLLLIMGLGSQMIRWHQGFCKMLAQKGLYVIRFDNRDVGLSEKMDNAPTPGMDKILSGKGASYLLSDMAKDAAGLLTALDIPRAHVCGLSMGGMIAQTMAIECPERLLSFISLESTTGEPGLPPPTDEAMKMLISMPPSDREAYIAHMVEVFRGFSSGSPYYDEAMEREKAALSYERCYYPPGVARQMAAIVASGSRNEALEAVRIPALVLHGDMDALVPPAHGQATARVIPGARLVIVKGLGHGLAYPELWAQITDEISTMTIRGM